MTRIIVKNIVNDSFSPKIGHEFGFVVAQKLEATSNTVEIDFEGITSFTTLFFNAMFAELEKIGSLEKIPDRLIIMGLDDTDMKTYNRSLKFAKKKQEEEQ